MDWSGFFHANWHVKVVCVLLIVAAYIDGKQLRVPNWLTFPMVFSGLIYSSWVGGWPGLSEGLVGMLVGLATLLPLYAVGGMGAGDVKLMGGVGAWIYWTNTYYCIIGFAVIGALMAVAMVVLRGKWKHHYTQFWQLLREIRTVKDPEKLSELAAQRKPTMMLLPYGIPIAIATIGYFLWTGMLV